MMISVVDKRQLYVRETTPNIVISAMEGKHLLHIFSPKTLQLNLTNHEFDQHNIVWFCFK